MDVETAASQSQVSGCYDGLAGAYDRDYQHGTGARGLMMEAYDTVTWTFIDRYLPRHDVGRPMALDAGGGTGKWALRLVEQGMDVHLIDISRAMIDQALAKARERGMNDHFRASVATITDIPFPADHFDFVLCEGDPVSYCLEERQRALTELVRVARPGSFLVIGLDNLLNYFWTTLRVLGFDAAMTLLESKTSRCPYGLPVHTFSPRELTELLEEAGARVVRFVGKPLIATNLLLWESALAATVAGNPDMRQRWLAAEILLAEEGYADPGGHLQVICQKR